MSDGQAAPKKGMNPILKWLLIGCGTVVLIGILVMASCVYLFKKTVYDPAKAGIAQVRSEAAKQGITVDTSKGLAAGLQSAANQGVVKGMVAEGNAVAAALPAAERPAAQAAYKALDEKKVLLTADDMAELFKAHATYQDAMMANMQAAANGQPKPMDPEASRALLKTIQEVVARH
ncbi:MAG TPA: hypothetical protein VFF76_02075 [Holophagaceae bacterium]|jgi:hypothetical protein|nr:hypothetical protein [Holophagaceae bacterium]